MKGDTTGDAPLPSRDFEDTQLDVTRPEGEDDAENALNNNDRPFKCQHCDKKYRTLRDLKRHGKESLCARNRQADSTSISDGSRTWSCPRCNIQFNSRFSTQRHINDACWKNCDECCEAGELHCDSHSTESECHRCHVHGISCTKRTEAVEDCAPVQAPDEPVQTATRSKRKAEKSPEDDDKPTTKNQRPNRKSASRRKGGDETEEPSQPTSRGISQSPIVVYEDPQPYQQRVMPVDAVVRSRAPTPLLNMNHQQDEMRQASSDTTGLPKIPVPLPSNAPPGTWPGPVPQRPSQPPPHSALSNAQIEEANRRTHMLRKAALQRSHQLAAPGLSGEFVTTGFGSRNDGLATPWNTGAFQQQFLPQAGNFRGTNSDFSTANNGTRPVALQRRSNGISYDQNDGNGPSRRSASSSAPSGQLLDRPALGSTWDSNRKPVYGTNGQFNHRLKVPVQNVHVSPVNAISSAQPGPAPNDRLLTIGINDELLDSNSDLGAGTLTIRSSQKFGPQLVAYCEKQQMRFGYELMFVYRYEAPEDKEGIRLFAVRWNTTADDMIDAKYPDVRILDGDQFIVVERTNWNTPLSCVRTLAKILEGAPVQAPEEFVTAIDDEISYMQKYSELRKRCDHLENVYISLHSGNQKLASENTLLRNELIRLRGSYGPSRVPSSAPAHPQVQSGLSLDATTTQVPARPSRLPPPNRQLWPSTSLTRRPLNFQDVTAPSGSQQIRVPAQATGADVVRHLRERVALGAQSKDSVQDTENTEVLSSIQGTEEEMN